MRWKKKQRPAYGTLRIVRKFLWTPKQIGDETRWLCFATIVREYVRKAHPVHPSTPPVIARTVGYMAPGWIDIAWGD